MTAAFSVQAHLNPHKITHVQHKGDAELFSVDFTAWQEDNAAITGVTWTLEAGSAAISNEALSSGVASALITTATAGKSIVSVLATTATATKKVFIELVAKDYPVTPEDY